MEWPAASGLCVVACVFASLAFRAVPRAYAMRRGRRGLLWLAFLAFAVAVVFGAVVAASVLWSALRPSTP